jgi:hypothetical protein
MRRHRRSVTAALVVLAVAAVDPAASQANPLLSGYGGPGQGNQAILGSALLNTPRGGSGGGSGGGSIAAVPRAAGGGEAPGSSSQPTGARLSGGQGAAGARHKHGQASGKVGNASASGSRANTPSTPSRAAAVRDSSQPLGMSGRDLVYLFLAAGALVVTAAVTRRMARRVP